MYLLQKKEKERLREIGWRKKETRQPSSTCTCWVHSQHPTIQNLVTTTLLSPPGHINFSRCDRDHAANPSSELCASKSHVSGFGFPSLKHLAVLDLPHAALWLCCHSKRPHFCWWCAAFVALPAKKSKLKIRPGGNESANGKLQTGTKNTLQCLWITGNQGQTMAWGNVIAAFSSENTKDAPSYVSNNTNKTIGHLNMCSPRVERSGACCNVPMPITIWWLACRDHVSNVIRRVICAS